MDITMLGTGSALVTECYNTCFVMSDGDEHFLVDGGGGNGILSQLKKAGFNWQDMRTIFVTHKHVDHILGLHLVEVNDGDTKEIMDRKVTFFDTGSTKTKQFGFCMDMGDGAKITCCGDEPYNDCEEKYARGSKWLLHEAFCLYSETDIFDPYEKHHSTVKDACELAEKLEVQNLLLYHTEDKNITHRKELYVAEGKRYYSGNLHVPDDLEKIRL